MHREAADSVAIRPASADFQHDVAICHVEQVWFLYRLVDSALGGVMAQVLTGERATEAILRFTSYAA